MPAITRKTSNLHAFASLLFLASEHQYLNKLTSQLTHLQKKDIITISDNKGDTLLHLMFAFGEEGILSKEPYFTEFYSLYCDKLNDKPIVKKDAFTTQLEFPETPLFLTALENNNESMMIYGLKHLTSNIGKHYVDYKKFHHHVLDKSKSTFELKQSLLANCLNDTTHPIHEIPKTTRLLGLLFELALEFNIEPYLNSCLTSLPVTPSYVTPKLASESTPLYDEHTYLFSPLRSAAYAERLDIMQRSRSPYGL